MPILVSYFIIPLVFLMLAVNVYFRVKMTKQFKALDKKGIEVAPKVFWSKKKRTAYFEKNHPQHIKELNEFSESMDMLIKLVVIGFLLILISFCYLYFNQ